MPRKGTAVRTGFRTNTAAYREHIADLFYTDVIVGQRRYKDFEAVNGIDAVLASRYFREFYACVKSYRKK